MSWTLHIRNGSWPDLDASISAGGQVLESLTIKRVLDMTVCDACSRSRETHRERHVDGIKCREVEVEVDRHVAEGRGRASSVLAILRLLPTDRRWLLSGLVSQLAS
jgi:hypothetical protein